MPSTITITDFVGEDIREQKLHKHNIAASCAINSLLHDGALRPIPCPEEVCSHDFTPRSIWSSPDCECIGSASETMYSEGNGFVYYAQENHIPRKSGCLCEEGEAATIGMPRPWKALTASGKASGCDYDPHVYFYTFVAEYCNGCESEGPLSPPSNAICGNGVVGGGLPAPAGYGITKRRIYKSTAGWKSGEDGSPESTGGVTLIAEVGPNAGYTDVSTLRDTTMISPITQNMLAMPRTGKGIGVSAFSVFVWDGNTLYFSAPGMTDVMLPEGEFRFDHDIIMAYYWNQSVYVLTEKWNYRIDEQANQTGVVRSNPPHRYELIAPIHNKYSVSAGNTGIYYVSKAGIMLLSGDEAVNVGTSLMPTSKWRSMGIDNAKVHIHNQYMFLYSRDWEYSHIFEIEDGAHQDVRYSNHVRYPYSISATHNDHNGDMLFASGEKVYRFKESTRENRTDCESFIPICCDCCPYDYTISTQDQTEVLDIASAYLHIDSTNGDVKFTLWDGECGKQKIYEKTFTGCGIHEFKLPSCHSSSAYHTVQLEGCATVYEMRLSSSNKHMGLNSE